MNGEETIFEQALGIKSAPAREAYLHEACAGNQPMFERLHGLLRAHDRAGGFLEHAQPTGGASGLNLAGLTPASAGARASPLTEKPGDCIGPYKLLQQIGEGGCGVVYMAEQEKPLRRRVALKIIKLGMDTRQVVARFEAERQALALMDHPNIARVFDAGATGTGRPYFVMELVRGVKITDYCDDKQLPTQERLKLFIQVCQAVQHAHQKGIIHRDLKPSNILVTVNDGVAVPKVIDFGIAKATTGERLTDKTVFTAFEQFIGTPAYMSPEQAELTSLDIDTRSDIYSLGVLLYELLTGQTPFDAKELLQAGLEAMRRTLREQEPERPSTKLSTLGAEALTTTARRRGLEPPKLVNAVQGDLDWIVMKCLEKDRARRYETANGLARDVQRHLGHEPVIARPPSRLYEFQKTVRRHKFGFAAGGAVVASLLIGLGAATWMFANEREARQRAQTEAAKSQQVARFLEDMLGSVNPDVAAGLDTTLLRRILDRTAERIDKDLRNQPEVEAEVRNTLGWVYLRLGEDGEAEEMYRAALAKYERLGKRELGFATSLQGIALVLNRKRPDPDWTKAESMLREALAIRRRFLGEHPDVASTLRFLGLVQEHEGKYEEAKSTLQGALAMEKKLLGNESLEVASTLVNISELLRKLNRQAEGQRLLNQGIGIFRKLGSDHPDLAYALGLLAKEQQSEGKLTEAEASLREELRIYRKTGLELDAAAALAGLAGVVADQGKQDEAERLETEVLALRRKLLASDDLRIAYALYNLWYHYSSRGKMAEAEPLVREELAIREKKAPDAPKTFRARANLGRSLLAQKKYAEAEPYLISGYEGMKQRFDRFEGGDQYENVALALNTLVQLCRASGRPEEAAKWRQDFAAWLSSRCQAEAEKGGVNSWNNLAWLLATCETTEARNAVSAIHYAEKAVAGTSRTNAVYLDTLAAAYAETGEFTKAVSIQKEALVLNKRQADMEGMKARLKLYESKTAYREP